MPRFEQIIRRLGNGDVELAVNESFLWRLDLPSGEVLRSDNSLRFWFKDGNSWYGPPPDGWDFSKAVMEGFKRQYTTVVDYS